MTATIALSSPALEAFTSCFRGGVLQPHDPGYDDARRVWNGMIDVHPALIARCTGAADVIDAVNFAREQELVISVRSGGHNVAGSAVCDGGLMIDLGRMRGVHVDPDTRRVRVQGGATWAEVDHETQVFGLATPSGYVSTTGVGGFTLGGGYGHLRRKYGMTCDNLRSADVVTADGRLLIASESENADLFWAIRGGGGNFGVVTSFEFECYPVGPIVFLCAVMYPLEQGSAVIRGWRDFMNTAPEELSSVAIVWSVPSVAPFPPELHNRPIVVLATLHPHDPQEGERLTRPLREMATPLLDLSGPVPYVAAQSSFDTFFPYGARRNYWKAIDLQHLGDVVIDRILEAGLERPSPSSLVPIWHFGGAMSRVEPAATAFWRRRTPYMVSFDAVWQDPMDDTRNLSWARTSWAAMRMHSDGGQYVNFPGFGEDGESQVRAGYGSNYARLAAVKATYDPCNLFRVNLNIRPAA